MKTEKPPYRVPSMAEIAAVPDNGLRVVSTFSGCGGSCLGYRTAGYRGALGQRVHPGGGRRCTGGQPPDHAPGHP
ncbi:MAG: hypothetical protein M5U12_17375 [Verrucomicrobia bacterium]|nr:hypothetical protein [Verrucomicrobiota bacterium]